MTSKRTRNILSNPGLFTTAAFLGQVECFRDVLSAYDRCQKYYDRLRRLLALEFSNVKLVVYKPQLLMTVTFPNESHWV